MLSICEAPYKFDWTNVFKKKIMISFNQSQISVFLTQLSEIRFNQFQPGKSFYFDKVISLMVNHIKPDFNVIIGDCAINFPIS